MEAEKIAKLAKWMGFKFHKMITPTDAEVSLPTRGYFTWRPTVNIADAWMLVERAQGNAAICAEIFRSLCLPFLSASETANAIASAVLEVIDGQ